MKEKGPNKLELLQTTGEAPTNFVSELESAPGSYRTYGRLKFFSVDKNYGFLISDMDNSDVFFHFDDLIGGAVSP